MAARIWKPGFRSLDLEARIWEPRSGTENNEKTLFFMENEIVVKNKEFRIGFVGIGLEHVTVAAARVTERPPRCSNKWCQKRRCI